MAIKRQHPAYIEHPHAKYHTWERISGGNAAWCCNCGALAHLSGQPAWKVVTIIAPFNGNALSICETPNGEGVNES